MSIRRRRPPTPCTTRLRRFLAAHDPERDGAAFVDLFKAQTSRAAHVRSYEPHYDGSPIVAGPADGVTGALGEHLVRARAGHHLAPLPLTFDATVYGQLGLWFTLLAFDTADAEVREFERSAAELGIPLKVVRDRLGPGNEAYESRMVLVRPDQFVAWAGDHAPLDVRALMRRVAARD